MERMLFQRLCNQMSRGDVILFTGAGFSLSARATGGRPLPSALELRKILWPIAFPGEPFDELSSLGDIYECAYRRAGNRVGDALREVLSVDASGVPDSYGLWFSMPWRRIYTLNVDNLDEALQRALQLPRAVRSISALTDSFPADGADLLSIHLNGRVADYPNVTFSPRQYGERTARPDPWYHHLVADLSSHPVVFVGTLLEESPLWQHIELRRSRESRTRELRPGSYLVTSSVPAARRAMLEDFNIQLVEMTQEQFAAEILAQMKQEAQQGLGALAARLSASSTGIVLQRIEELRIQPDDGTGEFLLGREPTWPDIVSGRAVERAFESKLMAELEESNARLLLLTGTAGSGKSTTLMRLALELQAEGRNVYWLDSEADRRIWQIRNAIRGGKPDVLAIDDADNFGLYTGPFLADVISDNPDVLVIAALRSTRLDQLDVEQHVGSYAHLTFTIPHLEDSDIDSLIDALTSARRLGQLRGLSRSQQVAAFRVQAGRQLLVAMIQATSNQRFDEKIDSECRELGADLGLIYATVAIATSLRTYLTKDEILLAIGDSSNQTLNRIQRLLDQRLLVQVRPNEIRVRHRVVADRAIDYYRVESQLSEPIQGLLWALATKVHPGLDRHSREIKLVMRLMNHQFMINITSDRETPRKAYALVEDVLGWNYHYYLQRGSYEVEAGDIDLAKNFLDQAKAMAPDDYMVRTEWAYMTLKRAATNASSVNAVEQAQEAFEQLEDAIESRGRVDPYPYHVLGSQGLSWVRRAILGKDEKARLLSRLLYTVKEGIKHHPKQSDLRQLADDLSREYLMTAVAGNPD